MRGLRRLLSPKGHETVGPKAQSPEPKASLEPKAQSPKPDRLRYHPVGSLEP